MSSLLYVATGGCIGVIIDSVTMLYVVEAVNATAEEVVDGESTNLVNSYL